MKRKWLWLFISCLVVGTLVLVSCGPAEEVEEEGTSTGEEPQYGGEVVVIRKVDVQSFDAGQGIPTGEPSRIANETLVEPMWEKGPAGENKVDWMYTTRGLVTFVGPSLAESWDFPEPGIMVFHIRKGVHWALDPNSEASKLVGGRELTVDDIISSWAYYINTPSSFLLRLEPELAEKVKITKTGPWDVKIEFPPAEAASAWKKLPMTDTPVLAPEVIEKYGHQNEWQLVVGTGAYMLTDFVPSSSATMTRNPNYWRKDPVGPGKGNQLPYIDTLKYLIIPDTSTQMAAIRTGQAHWIADATWEEAESVLKGNTKLKYIQYVANASPTLLHMRLDKPELPFTDVRVRQALMLATNVRELQEVFYGGKADLLTWPTAPIKGESYPYVPMEDMPKSVQDLFTYNPTKAKQLLDEAGYSSGFDVEVICQAANAATDVLSAVSDMWSKVNVTMDIQPREYAVWRSLRHDYDEMLLYNGQTVDIWTDGAHVKAVATNYSHIDDPMVWDAYEEIGDYILTDEQRAVERLKELNSYLVEQCYVIQLPRVWGYTIWWPWIMNYHGERGIMPLLDAGWVKYVWIDQEMKDQMVGK